MERSHSRGLSAQETQPHTHLRRLSYGAESLQFGDLYLPEGQGPHPVILLIHGGFWRNPYNLDLMTGLAKNIKKQRIAVWNIEYRRVGDTGGGWPHTLLDVALAADYLTTLATQYPLDLTRIIAIGHSAGGHLALWLAARQKLASSSLLATSGNAQKIAGVISLAGVSDLREAEQLHLGNDAVRELLGGDPDQFPERYRDASPAELLPLGVPQVLIHGTHDDRVPLTISEHYADKAAEAGDTLHLVDLPGVDHFALIDAGTEAWSTTLAEVQKLLAENL